MIKRIITAVVLIPLVVFVIHICELGTAAMLMVFSFIALSEYYGILGACGLGYMKFSGYLAAFLVLAGFLLKSAFCLNAEMPFFVLGVFVVLFECLARGGIRDAAGAVSSTVAGVVYTAVLPGYLILIRGNSVMGESFVYMLLLTTWASDIFAFFAGTAFGRHKLAPGISPNKSWEGLAAGILAGAGACAAYKYISVFPVFAGLGLAVSRLTLTECALIGGLLGITGQAGDLFESMLKRNAGVKDSGTLFPGHGGVLDRCDALIFNIPVFYLIIRALLRSGQ